MVLSVTDEELFELVGVSGKGMSKESAGKEGLRLKEEVLRLIGGVMGKRYSVEGGRLTVAECSVKFEECERRAKRNAHEALCALEGLLIAVFLPHSRLFRRGNGECLKR